MQIELSSLQPDHYGDAYLVVLDLKYKNNQVESSRLEAILCPRQPNRSRSACEMNVCWTFCLLALGGDQSRDRGLSILLRLHVMGVSRCSSLSEAGQDRYRSSREAWNTAVSHIEWRKSYRHSHSQDRPDDQGNQTLTIQFVQRCGSGRSEHEVFYQKSTAILHCLMYNKHSRVSSRETASIFSLEQTLDILLCMSFPLQTLKRFTHDILQISPAP